MLSYLINGVLARHNDEKLSKSLCSFFKTSKPCSIIVLMLLFNFCHSLLSSYRTEVLWTPGTHRGTQPPPHRSGPFNAGFFDISSKANSMSSIGICICILICSHTTFLQHCSSTIKMKKVIRK